MRYSSRFIGTRVVNASVVAVAFLLCTVGLINHAWADDDVQKFTRLVEYVLSDIPKSMRIDYVKLGTNQSPSHEDIAAQVQQSVDAASMGVGRALTDSEASMIRERVEAALLANVTPQSINRTYWENLKYRRDKYAFREGQSVIPDSATPEYVYVNNADLGYHYSIDHVRQCADLMPDGHGWKQDDPYLLLGRGAAGLRTLLAQFAASKDASEPPAPGTERVPSPKSIQDALSQSDDNGPPFRIQITEVRPGVADVTIVERKSGQIAMHLVANLGAANIQIERVDVYGTSGQLALEIVYDRYESIPGLNFPVPREIRKSRFLSDDSMAQQEDYRVLDVAVSESFSKELFEFSPPTGYEARDHIAGLTRVQGQEEKEAVQGIERTLVAPGRPNSNSEELNAKSPEASAHAGEDARKEAAQPVVQQPRWPRFALLLFAGGLLIFVLLPSRSTKRSLRVGFMSMSLVSFGYLCVRIGAPELIDSPLFARPEVLILCVGGIAEAVVRWCLSDGPDSRDDAGRAP